MNDTERLILALEILEEVKPLIEDNIFLPEHLLQNINEVLGHERKESESHTTSSEAADADRDRSSDWHTSTEGTAQQWLSSEGISEVSGDHGC